MVIRCSFHRDSQLLTSLSLLPFPASPPQAVRQTLEDMGVDTSAIRVSENYTTSISHCFSSPGGERTILMAPGRLQLEGGRERDRVGCQAYWFGLCYFYIISV